MTRSKNIVVALPALAAVVFFAGLRDTGAAVASTAAGAQMQAIVAATTAFLNSLSAEQRPKVLFAFTPQKTAAAATFARTGGPGGPHGPGGPPGGMRGRQSGQHPNEGGDPGHGPAGGAWTGAMGGFVGEKYGQAVWSNYPVSDMPRPGLRLGSLSAAQRDAAMYLLLVALGPIGSRKVLDIMGADQALSETGTPYCSGTACYTIGIFGEPSTTNPWMLEFGGHHLGLNLTIAGEHGVITPTLTVLSLPSIHTTARRSARSPRRTTRLSPCSMHATKPAQTGHSEL